MISPGTLTELGLQLTLDFVGDTNSYDSNAELLCVIEIKLNAYTNSVYQAASCDLG